MAGFCVRLCPLGFSLGDLVLYASSNSEEDAPVESDHDDGGNVEGTHRRKDKEVRVVEGAEGRCLCSSLCVVHSDGDR